jgi:glycosyltransferase involved in cell wall biosynthesis
MSVDLLPKRTVLVHDYLNQYGGAERVLEAMHELAPEAPVYTSMYQPDKMPDSYRQWDIHQTWIGKIPVARRNHQLVLPAYPLAFERLKLPGCDLVLSSSSAWAKMVAPPPGAVHVSYIHSPMRFAWNFKQYCEREKLPSPARIGLRPFMSVLRQRDKATLGRVDRLIANSSAVRDRIRDFWGRDAAVIFPPVEVDRFSPAPASEVQDYFLMVSRLVPYKRFDIAIEAFNRLKLPLWIIGDGRDRERLEAMAGPTVKFLGRLPDDEVRHIWARCRATVFASEDDFGIAQVESQAAGRPVIALAAGGVFDTVLPDETGVWVKEQTVDSLVDAVRRFDTLTFDTSRLVEHARGFSRQRYQRELVSVVNETLEARRTGERTWN